MTADDAAVQKQESQVIVHDNFDLAFLKEQTFPELNLKIGEIDRPLRFHWVTMKARTSQGLNGLLLIDEAVTYFGLFRESDVDWHRLSQRCKYVDIQAIRHFLGDGLRAFNHFIRMNPGRQIEVKYKLDAIVKEHAYVEQAATAV